MVLLDGFPDPEIAFLSALVSSYRQKYV